MTDKQLYQDEITIFGRVQCDWCDNSRYPKGETVALYLIDRPNGPFRIKQQVCKDCLQELSKGEL